MKYVCEKKTRKRNRGGDIVPPGAGRNVLAGVLLTTTCNI